MKQTFFALLLIVFSLANQSRALELLPDDSVKEIAINFKTKELINFALVSKKIFSILSDNIFLTNYLKSLGVNTDDIQNSKNIFSDYIVFIARCNFNHDVHSIETMFRADKNTWYCKPFLKDKASKNSNFLSENIFAEDGPLAKFDKLSNANLIDNKSIFYINRFFYKNFWHCINNETAAIASCLFDKPLHDIIYKETHFSKRDIEGLLTYFIREHITKYKLFSQKYINFEDSCMEPSIFLDALKKCQEKNVSFIIDYSNSYGHPMFSNIPFDRVLVYKAKNEDQNTEKYFAHLFGENIEKSIVSFSFQLTKDYDGKIITEDWILDECTRAPPEILWVPNINDNFWELMKFFYLDFYNIYLASTNTFQ